jgi:hypothetical protein
MTFEYIALLVILLAIIGEMWRRSREARRADFIRKYTLPPGLFEKLRQKRPELSLKDCQLVGHALRQFFLAYLRGSRRQIAMPSQVVDDLWHEFILYTRNYQLFCRHAFGRFLHHTPAAILGRKPDVNEGLRRCWWFACLEENINPRKATRLPLLFAIDRKLNIADGFVYAADCHQLTKREAYGAGARAIHCGTDFGDRSVDGSLSGYGSRGAGCSGCSSSDASGGHGCSASGCTGGCSGGCGGGGD